ncbi:MAG: winged helix-turn-helix transcriptional regulator [Anaerolineae bacterium]|nr:winged helix-turn-helix transcriptional regulator [Anaerolineae bacterium]
MQNEIGLTSGLFIMRSKGEKAYPILEMQLQSIPENEALVVCFPDDQLMDVSFADETIIRLGEEIAANKFDQRRLLLKGLTPDSIVNIDRAIRGQKLKLAFIHITSTGKWEIIGHLEPSLQEVLEMLANRERITAPELVQALDLALNTANNRLKRLFNQGLIQREYEVSDKGLLYYYRFPIPVSDRVDL